ncbi:MAG TPA: arylamine N-acetyltransferase [Paraburkholderia sp.]|jgi:N-hydroxyarylamine O-acetyltransferase|nr:arylamine N-acetyltransferase [Paraburkholderia sp.]
MSNDLDLDRYFSRIGYQGPRAATLEVLSELHRLHPLAIPFENLDPVTGRAVSLDLPAIADKLIARRRGGYCFEHNTLFAHVLMQLGFRVTPLIARVLWGRGPDAVTARSHMLLRVEIDDVAWLADVGFGGVTLTAPLHLVAGMPQPTPHEPFRLADASQGALDLEVQSGGTWAKAYRFDLQRAEWIDYEVSNWYTSAWPQSIFVNSLIVCRVLPHGRLSLFNDRLTERAASGEVVNEQALGDAAGLAACLGDRFGLETGGIDLPGLFERIKGQTFGG